jgi:DNA-binding CsgD family transcriptional regulator
LDLDLLDGASPYPALAIGPDGFVVAASPSACRYFGVSEQVILETDRARAPSRSEAEVALRDRHFPRWKAGELYPAQIGFRNDQGEYRFLIVPFGPPRGSSAAIVIVLFPAEILSAALEGDTVGAASAARRWTDRFGTTALDAARLADPQFAQLTGREWQIACGLANGERVRSIAQELRISQNTVRNHVKAAFSKLGVRSQVELVRRVRALS